MKLYGISLLLFLATDVANAGCPFKNTTDEMLYFSNHQQLLGRVGAAFSGHAGTWVQNDEQSTFFDKGFFTETLNRSWPPKLQPMLQTMTGRGEVIIEA